MYAISKTRLIFIWFGILLFLMPLVPQCQFFYKGASEQSVVDYFSSHNSQLDALEGIWLRKSITISKFKWPNPDKEYGNPLNSEVETVIVKLGDQYNVYSIVGGEVRVELGVMCMFEKSAIPGRFSFSSLPFKCDCVFPISFTIVNNRFSLSYENQCHSGDGLTLNTLGMIWDQKVIETWEKIYPLPQ